MNSIDADITRAQLSAHMQREQQLLSAVQQRATRQNISPEEAAKAARGFEALFIHELYKSMRAAMLDSLERDDEEMSFGADIVDSLGGLELAQHLARSGQGIGIAQMVYRYLTGEDLLPLITTHPPMSASSAHSALPPPQASTPTTENAKEASTTASSITQRLARYAELIDRIAAEENIPPWLVRAVIAAESAAIPTAVSPAGAKGLMQLMDATARELGVVDAFDPEDNIRGGTRYLRMMLDRFGSIPLALAAYNAGPAAVERYRGIPPYPETQQYVRRVLALARALEPTA